MRCQIYFTNIIWSVGIDLYLNIGGGWLSINTRYRTEHIQYLVPQHIVCSQSSKLVHIQHIVAQYIVYNVCKC